MTPKEKAVELVDKMYMSAIWSKEEDYNPLQQYQRIKLCALIAVDEIINIAPSDKSIFGTDYLTVKEYWQRVKQEIENL